MTQLLDALPAKSLDRSLRGPKRRVSVSLTLALAFFYPVTVAAQESVTLRTGMTVRATVLDGTSVQGVLRERRADTLWIAAGSSIRMLPMTKLHALERREGCGCPGTGAVVGLALGTLAGMLYGSAGHPGLPHTEAPAALEYTPPVALAGAVLGLLIGRQSTWNPVDIPPHLPGPR